MACFKVGGRRGIVVALWGALWGALAAAVVGLTGAAAELPAAPSAADAEFFESRVRPLLLEHCSACHSRAAGEPEGNLSFDTRSETLGHEGLATPGKPEQSLLVEVVRYDGKLQMPPDGRLPLEAIATLEEWVHRGLPWPVEGAVEAGATDFDIATRKADHWCWQPPQSVPVPPVGAVGWCRSDIDRFVLARLEAAGLAPAPEASRAQLVRRAAELLTGLPADPADVDRVVADPDPLAFEKFVDDLLASPHFGERFARHWLDVVRYGETRGHEFDFPIPNAWRYRDWVIDSLNADLPYDQFVREQIAGDLLDSPRLNATGADLSVIGTGFWYLGEEIHSPVDIAQDAADRTDNRVDTFGKAFLGMALGCARCHDHKFDAISKEDYYAIAGMLASSSYRQVPFESLPANREVAGRLDAHDAEARLRLGRAAADTLAGGEGPAVEDLARLAVRVTATLPPREALLALKSGGAGPEGEIVIADYSRAEEATALIGDGFAWGVRPRPAGEAVIVAGAEGTPARLRIEPTTSAHFDSLWAGLASSGEREAGALGGADRAGRVLRTPKMRIEGGTVWHRVRGHLQIFTCVDSHILLVGPLYGSTLQTVDTQGEWKWVRQDLGSDLDWRRGHLVHVEYVPIAGAADVAEVVASPTEPKRADLFLTELARRLPAEGGDDAAIAALIRDCVAAKRAAHGIDTPAFERPARAMYQIGGGACTPRTSLMAQARELDAARATITATAKLASAIAPAILDGNGVDHPVLAKGSAARPAAIVPRRFLEAVDGGQQPVWPASSSGRRELASRVLDPANPLTARVAVNRFWHHLFGRGLVPTPDNFGKLGEPFADAGARALLDTLAVRFREEGWSMKRLVREIVTSSTWRMQSVADPRGVERDPTNRLLHHFPLRRLEGEAVRDKILAVSGRLDPKVGGPPVEVALSDFHEGRGKPGSGPLDGDGRRSIYTRIRRNFLPAIPLAFDMPVPFQAMGRRNVTNVPAQALTLMNDPFVVEQSGRWAARILAASATSVDDSIVRMYREAFARVPSPDEVAAARGFLVAQTALHGGDFAADQRLPAAWADLAHALVNAKEFIFIP
ncbi:MAG: DUF1553 domain-containing protein [Planctomycetota bacterium]|nr:DUF1553 domain-containing protein [Planctomycetota bacterium]